MFRINNLKVKLDLFVFLHMARWVDVCLYETIISFFLFFKCTCLWHQTGWTLFYTYSEPVFDGTANVTFSLNVRHSFGVSIVVDLRWFNLPGKKAVCGQLAELVHGCVSSM